MSGEGRKKHNRRLGLLAADLVQVRFTHNLVKVMSDIRDELERKLIESGYFSNAPFEWITLSLRIGLKNENSPHYQRINEEYGDLPLAIEVNAEELRAANPDEFRRLLVIGVLKSPAHAAKRFKLNASEVNQWLASS